MSKIFGWLAGHDGCGYYRIKLPFEALERYGHEVYADTFWDEDWRDCDVVVGQRVTNPEPSRLWQATCASPNVTAVYELDDDLFNLDPTNPAHEVFALPEVQRQIRQNIGQANRVVVSTEPLAQQVRHFNDSVHVIKNSLPYEVLRMNRVDQGGDRGLMNIGYQGSPTHAMDFARIEAPLYEVLAKNPAVRFIGAGTPYGMDAIHPAQYLFRKWVDSPLENIRSFSFQIGLAPLNPSPFNLSKSYLKVLEYWCRGIVPVASNYGPYRELIEDGVTGFLCRGERDWREKLELLIHDHELRQKMSDAGYEAVADHIITSTGKVDEWSKAYGLM